MDTKIAKKGKKPYFAPSKKEPLVKRMIFDSHEVSVPASCFELRPIHENQSNQQDIIFDPESSSLKEISEIDKNSPHQLDKMIYGHIDHSMQNEVDFMDCERFGNSPHFNSKSQEESSNSESHSNPIKRENPVSHEETKRFERISKIIQITKQHTLPNEKSQTPYKYEKTESKIEYFNNSKIDQGPENEKRKKFGIIKVEARKSEREGRNKKTTEEKIIKEEEVEKQEFYDQPLSYEMAPEEYVKIEENYSPINFSEISRKETRRIPRKKVGNPEFQLINQYMELASYAALIDEMILVFDKSPLFQFPLEFDSETDESDRQDENQALSIEKFPKEKIKMEPECQVKIEEDSSVEDELPKSISSASNLKKNEKELYTEIQKLKISEAPNEKEKQRIIKEIKFNHSKMFYNFYEPIKELRPYMKKMSFPEKELFLAFKTELKEIKDIIDYFQKKNQGDKKEHICKICGDEFESGRQLGGHMSRKHPGKAIEYGFRKQLHKVKEIERNRRKYFKDLEEKELKIEHEEN